MASEEKKRRVEEENGAQRESFAGFTLTRVLNENSERKSVTVEGRFEGSDDPAIVILEKIPFFKDGLSEVVSERAKLKELFHNHLYSKFECSLPPELNLLKANLVYPATEKHIAKHESRDRFLVLETPSIYKSMTLPFIEQEPCNVQWVYNILEHRKESETIVYEDPNPDKGFILLPDFKWNGKLVEDMYLICIIHHRHVKSIRDLTPAHLPMLKNMWTKCTNAIYEKYKVPPSQIRAYFHYQPSYYHLHVHFTYIGYNAPGINTEKAHMLNTVIANLEKQPDYYARATLPFVIKDGTSMYKYFEKSGFDFHCPKPIEETKSTVEGLTKFFRAIDKAKHEPSGEHWDVTYAESAWRMAVMAICLPRDLRRKRIVKMALSSALTCLGRETDHSSEWSQKKAEVRDFLFANLPVHKAAELFELFLEHVKARIGSALYTREEKIYRKLLEFEETLLLWEEIRKESEDEDEKKAFVKRLFQKMCEVEFPGYERYVMFKDPTELSNLFGFIMQISSLLSLKRTGWVRMGVRNPENVASHMFRMGMMAIALEEDPACSLIQNGSSIIVSILHDIPECIVGDLTPKDKVAPEEKHRMEMQAMRSLVEKLPGPLAKDLYSGFERYEMQATGDQEAMLTKDLDKYDMILQAFDYEVRSKRGPFLEEFYTSTQDVFKTERIKALAKHLYGLRSSKVTPANNDVK